MTPFFQSVPSFDESHDDSISQNHLRATPKIEAIIPFASMKVARDWPYMCEMLRSAIRSVLAMPDEFIFVSFLGHEHPDKLPLGSRCIWTTVEWDPPHGDDVPGKLNEWTGKYLDHY